jgi:thioredoxin 1
MEREYAPETIGRAQVDALPGPTVVEFGTNWCGYCQGAQPAIAAALDARDDVRHLKVEDGPGRPLGRSYRVKLWPTLVFLKDGVEVARVVRPASADEVRSALAQLVG